MGDIETNQHRFVRRVILVMKVLKHCGFMLTELQFNEEALKSKKLHTIIEKLTMCCGEYRELPSPSRKAALCKSSLATSASDNPAISISIRSGQNSATSHGLKAGQSTIEVKQSMTGREKK